MTTKITKLPADIDVNANIDLKLTKNDLLEIAYSETEEQLESDLKELETQFEDLRKKIDLKKVINKTLPNLNANFRAAYTLYKKYWEFFNQQSKKKQCKTFSEFKKDIEVSWSIAKSPSDKTHYTIYPYYGTGFDSILSYFDNHGHYIVQLYIDYNVNEIGSFYYPLDNPIDTRTIPELKSYLELEKKVDEAENTLKEWQRSKTKIKVAFNKQILNSTGLGAELLTKLKKLGTTSPKKLLNIQ